VAKIQKKHFEAVMQVELPAGGRDGYLDKPGDPEWHRRAAQRYFPSNQRTYSCPVHRPHLKFRRHEATYHPGETHRHRFLVDVKQAGDLDDPSIVYAEKPDSRWPPSASHESSIALTETLSSALRFGFGCWIELNLLLLTHLASFVHSSFALKFSEC